MPHQTNKNKRKECATAQAKHARRRTNKSAVYTHGPAKNQDSRITMSHCSSSKLLNHACLQSTVRIVATLIKAGWWWKTEASNRNKRGSSRVRSSHDAVAMIRYETPRNLVPEHDASLAWSARRKEGNNDASHCTSLHTAARARREPTTTAFTRTRGRLPRRCGVWVGPEPHALAILIIVVATT